VRSGGPLVSRDMLVTAPASATRLGCDVVELERFQRVLNRNPREFLDGIFTVGEQQAAASTEAFARRFAAKEATLKALGIGLVAGIELTDIEVSAVDDGRCDVILHGAPAVLARGRRIDARTWIETGRVSAIVWIGRAEGDLR